jgi:nitrogenase subunit NifH
MATAPDSESAGEIRKIAEQIVALDRGTIVKPLTLVSR